MTPSSSPSTSRRSISRRCSRRVAGAVGREPLASSAPTRSAAKRWISSAALRLFAKQIVRSPRPTSVGQQPRRLAERARAHAELLVERAAGSRARSSARRAARASSPITVASTPEQRVRELAGVRDRRGGEQELRLGAVDPREPPQPAQHVADVRAEDAAVDVRLVDDDVAEVLEHVAPAVVVRQHADVEHVRVREDHVRPLADLPAPLGGRVAVVDRGPQLRHAVAGERPGLVLRERLRRVEVERARSSARARARRAPAG